MPSSICQTITTQGSNILLTSTTLIAHDIITTAPPTTITTSIPVVASSCSTPIQPIAVVNSTNLSLPPVCSTSTTFSLSSSIVPGAVITATSFSTSVATITSAGLLTITTCSTLPTTSSTILPLPVSTTSTAPTTSSSPSSTSTPSATTTAPLIPPSSVNLDSTVTSFSTVLLTTFTDGQLTTATSLTPIIQSDTGSSGSSSPNTGALAGGVIGGIIGLALIILGIWYAKRRGFFSGSGDDQFGDEMWQPAAHGGTGTLGTAVLADREEDDDANGGEMSQVNNNRSSSAANFYARPLSYQSQNSGGHYDGNYQGNGSQGQAQGYRPDYGGARSPNLSMSEYGPSELAYIPAELAGAAGVHRAYSNNSNGNGHHNNGSRGHSRQNSAGFSNNGGHLQQENLNYSPQSNFNNNQLYGSPNNRSPPSSPQQYKQPMFYPTQPLSYNNNRPQQTDLSRIPSSSAGHSESGRTVATTGSSTGVGGGGIGNSLSIRPMPFIPSNQMNGYESRIESPTSESFHSHNFNQRPGLEVLPESIPISNSSSSSNENNHTDSNSNSSISAASTPPSLATHSIFSAINHNNTNNHVSPEHSPNTSTGSHTVGLGLKRQDSIESLKYPSQFLGAKICNATTPKEERSGLDFGDVTSLPTESHTTTN